MVELLALDDHFLIGRVEGLQHHAVAALEVALEGNDFFSLPVDKLEKYSCKIFSSNNKGDKKYFKYGFCGC